MALVLILAALVVVWVIVGFVARVPLLRAGRSMTWFTAALAGPFVIPIVIEYERRNRKQSPRVVGVGTPGEGPVDTLVGVDPSPAAQQALRSAIDVFGSRIGRLVIATVIPHDYRDPGERQQVEHEAEVMLERTRTELANRGGAESRVAPELVVLHGGPADALVEYANAKGMHVIVVGKRGTGLAKTVLGSVASRLARDAHSPVLIVGD